MLTEKEWKEAAKNLETEIEEGVLKVTKEFIKEIRNLVAKQKQTETVEKFANALGIEPSHDNQFSYDSNELDECEIEITEE